MVSPVVAGKVTDTFAMVEIRIWNGSGCGQNAQGELLLDTGKQQGKYHFRECLK
jgi:hypothetical protein